MKLALYGMAYSQSVGLVLMGSALLLSPAFLEPSFVSFFAAIFSGLGGATIAGGGYMIYYLNVLEVKE